MMSKSIQYGAMLGAALMAFGAAAPMAARADDASRQKNKNQWRNLAYGSAALTAYGLLKHDKTLTILGAAGTAYTASRYEKDRHSQSQESARRQQLAREWSQRNRPRYFHTARPSHGAPAFYQTRFTDERHVPHGHAWGWHRHHDND